jgi:hypothetical protein
MRAKPSRGELDAKEGSVTAGWVDDAKVSKAGRRRFGASFSMHEAIRKIDGWRTAIDMKPAQCLSSA